VPVIGSIGIPKIKAMTPLRGTPFVPGKILPIVIALHIRSVGTVQMPFSYIAQAVTFFFKDIRPASIIFP
jgi:hypothetical protein